MEESSGFYREIRCDSVGVKFVGARRQRKCFGVSATTAKSGRKGTVIFHTSSPLLTLSVFESRGSQFINPECGPNLFPLPPELGVKHEGIAGQKACTALFFAVRETALAMRLGMSHSQCCLSLNVPHLLRTKAHVCCTNLLILSL